MVIKSSDVSQSKAYLDNLEKGQVAEAAKPKIVNQNGNSGYTFQPPKGSEVRSCVIQTRGKYPNTTTTIVPGIYRFINLDVFPQKPQSSWQLHNGDARLLIDAWVKDDANKNMHIYYPYEDPSSPNYMQDNNPFIAWINDVLSEALSFKKVISKKTGKEVNKPVHTSIYAERHDHGMLEGKPEAEGLPTLAQVYMYVCKGGDSDEKARGLIGKKILCCNVIDRMDMEYHRTNKMFKLFAQSVDVTNPEAVKYKDAGKFFLYDKLMTASADLKYGLDFNKVDLAIKAQPDDKLKNAYIAVIQEASEAVEHNYLSPLTKGYGFTEEQLRQYVVSSPDLSEEEMSWTPVDIDKVYPITSMNAIAKRLKGWIGAWDKMTGSNYLERINSVAAMEVETSAEDKANEQENIPETPAYSAPVQEEVETPAPSFDNMDNVPDPLDAMSQPVAAARPAARPTSNTPFGDSGLDFSDFKGLTLLKPEDLDTIDIEGMKAAIGTPDAGKYFAQDGKVTQLKYKATVTSPIYTCEGLGPAGDEGCGCLNPLTFGHCAKCGWDYNNPNFTMKN